MNNVARGPHGSYVPGSSRGDVTGRAFLAATGQKADRESARKRTINALLDEPTVTVAVPGGGTYLIPRAAHDQIVATVEEQAARGSLR